MSKIYEGPISLYIHRNSVESYIAFICISDFRYFSFPLFLLDPVTFNSNQTLATPRPRQMPHYNDAVVENTAEKISKFSM